MATDRKVRATLFSLVKTAPQEGIAEEQGGGGGGRNKAWDREMMFSQLAKRSARQRF